jgi:hypothetical protein
MEIGEALAEDLVSASGDSVCSKGSIFLGFDTYYRKLTNSGGVYVGIIEFHHCKDNEWSGGHVPFDNSGSSVVWTVNSLDPLDLSPSIACRTCGHHGFIHGGKWVPA